MREEDGLVSCGSIFFCHVPLNTVMKTSNYDFNNPDRRAGFSKYIFISA